MAGPRRPASGRGSLFSRAKPSPGRKGSIAVKSHHRHSPQGRVEPAPDCLPDVARIPVTVAIKGWTNPMSCAVVRVDHDTKQILVSLPDNLPGRHHAATGQEAVIGWPGHDVWHESKTKLSSTMQPGNKYFWLRITGGPVHHERRRFVRAKQIRPVTVHMGRHQVSATSMDLSETAIRLVTKVTDPVRAGDKVHVLFSTHHRQQGKVVPMALDGHVYRTRELDEGQAGRKEVVIFFENLVPSQQDFIRGLVYDLHLQDKRPVTPDY